MGMMTKEQIEHFNQELDGGASRYPNPGSAASAWTVFYQRGYPAMVLRYITSEMPRLEDLGDAGDPQGTGGC